MPPVAVVSRPPSIVALFRSTCVPAPIASTTPPVCTTVVLVIASPPDPVSSMTPALSTVRLSKVSGALAPPLALTRPFAWLSRTSLPVGALVKPPAPIKPNPEIWLLTLCSVVESAWIRPGDLVAAPGAGEDDAAAVVERYIAEPDVDVRLVNNAVAGVVARLQRDRAAVVERSLQLQLFGRGAGRHQERAGVGHGAGGGRAVEQHVVRRELNDAAARRRQQSRPGS